MMVALASLALALAAAPPAPTAIFEDVTDALGLSFEYRNFMTGGLHLPEIMGPGVALFDADNDGDLDLFLVQGARLGPAGEAPSQGLAGPDERPRFFRNDSRPRPDGTREPRFASVPDAVGPLPAGFGLGVATGDYDGDGFVDLYVTRYGTSLLLKNVDGKRFEDVTAKAGVAAEGWSASAAFVDYDRDGRLDLFVVQYVVNAPVKCFRASTRRDYCGPKSYRPRVSRLFRNLGDGRFEDAARALAPERPGPGLGVVTLDADGDSWPDLYVANDGFDNFLWLNQKGRGFREDGLLAGVALNRTGLAEAGMGVDAADVTGDGLEDLFVTNLSQETNTLYVNLGEGLFEDRTLAAGLGPSALPWTGFGTRLVDIDNDGALDIVIVNGAVHLPDEADPKDPLPLGQPKLLFRNLGKGTFADVTAQAGAAFARHEVSRGLAVGDLDDDGDVDLVVANNIGPSRVLLNRVGQDAPWLGLRLRLADGKRDALGARVALRRQGAPDLVRRARVDASYASAGDPRVLFGLGGGSDVKEVEVQWPDGQIERFPAPPLRRYTTLQQGTGSGSGSGNGRGGPGGPDVTGAPQTQEKRAARRPEGSPWTRYLQAIVASAVHAHPAPQPLPAQTATAKATAEGGLGGPKFTGAPQTRLKRAARRPVGPPWTRYLQAVVASAVHAHPAPQPHPAQTATATAATATPTATQPTPTSPSALIPFPSLEGMEEAVARQLAQVRAQVEQAQREGSATAAVYGEAGRRYHAYELSAAAEACYRAAIERAPDDFRWPYLLGLLLEQAGRLDEAAASYERALRPADKYYPAFIRLAGVELARGRTEAAAAALEVPRAHSPDDPALLAALGQLALLRREPEEARRLLELALERQPRATRLHYPLGLALRALGRTDEARRQLERAGRIGVQPRDPLAEGVQALRLGENAHLMEGHAAYRAGDFRAAADAYARAFEASGSTSAGALVNLAAAEQRLGQAATALAHLEQARAIDPDAPAVLFNLGVLLRQAGRDAQAVPHLQHLVARAPQDDEARVELTLALFALGRAAEALDALAPLAQPPRGRCAALLAALARVEAADAPELRARAAVETARFTTHDRCRP